MKVRLAHHEHLTDLDWQLRKVDVLSALYLARRRLGQNGILGITSFIGGNKEVKFEMAVDRLKSQGLSITDLGDSAVYVPERTLFLTNFQECETSQGHVLYGPVDRGVFMPSSRDLPLEQALNAKDNQHTSAIIDHPRGHRGAGAYLMRQRDLVYSGRIEGYELSNALAVWPFGGLTVWNPNQLAHADYESLREGFEASQAHSPFEKRTPFRMGALYASDGHRVPPIGRTHTVIDLPVQNLDALLHGRDLKAPLRAAIQANLPPIEGHSEPAPFDAFWHASRLVGYRLRNALRRI